MSLTVRPTLRDAAEQALEALERADKISGYGNNRKTISALRAALADTQDWNEVEALRASLREHMAEIHRLRAAGRQALDAMDYTRWAVADYAQKWGIPRHDAAMNTLRAALEPVTICHDKEGDKLSPPLPILAVHVGYRYQSPIGGWEYGDHIPAGFDTDKWAHQKIYILQEQS